MNLGTIFGLQPFEPKRTLILPCKGGEITLYVLDGQAYVAKLSSIGEDSPRIIQTVHFGGWGSPWGPSFQNVKLDVAKERVVSIHDLGLEYCYLEVVFRLVPSDNYGQTAEIVAITFDGGETFYENELCTLPAEYAEPVAQAS